MKLQLFGLFFRQLMNTDRHIIVLDIILEIMHLEPAEIPGEKSPTGQKARYRTYSHAGNHTAAALLALHPVQELIGLKIQHLGYYITEYTLPTFVHHISSQQSKLADSRWHAGLHILLILIAQQHRNDAVHVFRIQGKEGSHLLVNPVLTFLIRLGRVFRTNHNQVLRYFQSVFQCLIEFIIDD